jgi:hypothetical protein
MNACYNITKALKKPGAAYSQTLTPGGAIIQPGQQGDSIAIKTRYFIAVL